MRHARRTRCVVSVRFALALVTGLVLAGPAAADEPSAREATRLKSEGDEAFRALRYADALRAYEASYALVANPLLHYNRGRALEALERFPEAVDELEAFEREATPELRARTTALAAHLVELRKRVATVRVVVSEDGARVLLRANVVGLSPLAAPLRVNQGPARIEVEREGFQSIVVERDLRGGEETLVRIELVPKPAPVSTSPTPGESREGSVLSRWWFWTAAGVVVAGAAVVTYAATRKAPPREGDVGQLTSPLLRF